MSDAGCGKSGTRELVISADGMRDLIPVVQRLIRLTGFDTYLHFSTRPPAGLLA